MKLKQRNKFGTSAEPSWHLQKSQGVRVRGDKNNFQQNPDGSDAIRGARPVNFPDGNWQVFKAGVGVTARDKPTDAFTPPRTSTAPDWSPASNWRPADGKGVRGDTGTTDNGQRYPRLRRPDRGR